MLGLHRTLDKLGIDLQVKLAKMSVPGELAPYYSPALTPEYSQ